MIRIPAGDTIPLTLELSDGSTAMFPRALLYDGAGTLLATVNLTALSNGLYVNFTQVMPSSGFVEAVYIVYSDSGHTTLAAYGRAVDVFSVPSTVPADANLVKWLGTTPAGCNNLSGPGTGPLIPAAVVSVGVGSAGDYPHQDDEGEVWPRVLKVSESTAARATVFFYVLSAPWSGSLGAGPGPSTWSQVFRRQTHSTLTTSVNLMLVPRVSKNGGAFASAAGTLTELGEPGLFSYTFTAAELNTLGYVLLEVGLNSPDGIVKGRVIPFHVVAEDVYDSVRHGMTALPNAAAEAAGGLYTRGTGAGQINQDANGRVDARVAAYASGQAPPAAAAVVAALMAFAHDTGVTVDGLFKRLEALVGGKAEQLDADGTATVKFYLRDGVTVAFQSVRDTAAGSRTTAVVTGSE